MKPGTSTNALAKRGTSAVGISDSLSHGGRGLLASSAGVVACELEPLGVDASGARYELRVTNGTALTLGATASAVRADDRRPIAAIAVEVEPRSAVRTGFSLDAGLAYERVTAEVRGDNVHLIVEAAPPQGRRSPNRWTFPATALGAAALLAGGVLVLVGAARPRIVDATLGPSMNGRLVARWSTTGAAVPTYDLRDPAGTVVAHGTLPAASGTLPLGRQTGGTLHVAVSNAFGSDARDAVYAQAAAPRAVRLAAIPPPRIGSISVEPASKPGAPVRVRYSAHARDVRISIVDRNGHTWFSTAALPGTGLVEIPAPTAGPRAPYSLIARASHGGAVEQTRVPFPVVALLPPSPDPSPTPAPPSPSPGDTAPMNPENSGAAPSDEVAVRPRRVTGGLPFSVEVPFSGGAHVSVVRERDGVAVLGVNVPRGRHTAAFVAPARAGGPYWIHVTSDRGSDSVLLRRLEYRTNRS